MKTPKIKSKWRHDKSGAHYIVEMLTNMNGDQPDRYPPTVVYKGSDGRIWSAPLSEWADRMTPLAAMSVMCERKTDDIVHRLGYVKTGYVLRRADDDSQGDICVSEGGVVAWFKPEQWRWLMHNRDHVTFTWPKPIGYEVTAKKEFDRLMKEWDDQEQSGSPSRKWFELLVKQFLEK